MSKFGYRAIVLIVTLLVVIGGLAYGAFVELDIAWVSEGVNWEQYDYLEASVGWPVGVARFMFIATIAGMIVASFYNWPKGSPRGRIYVVVSIVGLIVSWVAVTAWAGRQVDNAISVAESGRPVGLPAWCEALYTIDPETGLSKDIGFIFPGFLHVTEWPVVTESGLTIRVGFNRLQPDDITIPANRDVEFNVFNAGIGDVRFVIDDLDVDLTVPECHLLSVTINAPAGEYVFRSESSDASREQEITGLLHVYENPLELNEPATPSGSPNVTRGASPTDSVGLVALDNAVSSRQPLNILRQCDRKRCLVSVKDVTVELSFDDPSSFVSMLVESRSAGVPTMHGRSDEERMALADAPSREMAETVARATVDGRLVSQSTGFIALGTRRIAAS